MFCKTLPTFHLKTRYVEVDKFVSASVSKVPFMLYFPIYYTNSYLQSASIHTLNGTLSAHPYDTNGLFLSFINFG